MTLVFWNTLFLLHAYTMQNSFERHEKAVTEQTVNMIFYPDFERYMKAVIEQTVNMICDSDSERHEKVVFTDAPDILQVSKSGKLPHPRKDLRKISVRQRVASQWVIVYWGVPCCESGLEKQLRYNVVGTQLSKEESVRILRGTEY